MKTREERAKQICGVHPDWSHVECMRRGYIMGAESEHAELTRWNDPKEVMPERRQNVIVKYKYSHDNVYYTIGCYDGKWDTETGIIEVGTVIGWQEIHE